MAESRKTQRKSAFSKFTKSGKVEVYTIDLTHKSTGLDLSQDLHITASNPLAEAQGLVVGCRVLKVGSEVVESLDEFRRELLSHKSNGDLQCIVTFEKSARKSLFGNFKRASKAVTTAPSPQPQDIKLSIDSTDRIEEKEGVAPANKHDAEVSVVDIESPIQILPKAQKSGMMSMFGKKGTRNTKSTSNVTTASAPSPTKNNSNKSATTSSNGSSRSSSGNFFGKSKKKEETSAKKEDEKEDGEKAEKMKLDAEIETQKLEDDKRKYRLELLEQVTSNICEDVLMEAMFDISSDDSVQIKEDRDILIRMYQQLNGDGWKLSKKQSTPSSLSNHMKGLPWYVSNSSHNLHIQNSNEEENQEEGFGVGMEVGGVFCESSLKQWQGIKAQRDGEKEVVTEIDLHFNGLDGELPDCMGRLACLYALDLSCNSIFGEIPNSFSNLIHLKTLKLSGNKFTGMLPRCLCECNQLEHLDLSFNFFELDIFFQVEDNVSRKVKEQDGGGDDDGLLFLPDRPPPPSSMYGVPLKYYNGTGINSSSGSNQDQKGKERHVFDSWYFGPNLQEFMHELCQRNEHLSFFNISGNCLKSCPPQTQKKLNTNSSSITSVANNSMKEENTSSAFLTDIDDEMVIENVNKDLCCTSNRSVRELAMSHKP